MTDIAIKEDVPGWMSKNWERLGFPAVLLIAILYLIYRAGNWTAINVVLPVTKEHVKFVHEVNKTLLEQTEVLQGMQQNTMETTQILRELSGRRGRHDEAAIGSPTP